MAQGNVIDRFFIALGLDTKDVEKGIQSTVDTVKGGLKELLVGAVMPAVGALASGALVQQFTDEITQVDRLSKSLGINIEQMQAWQGAVENAGVAGEEIGELFADLNDWMIDAVQNQSGALYEYIEKGWLPAAQKANGEMKSTEQYALEMADALNKLGTQNATGVARQIGIGNAGLVGFLQQGSASISAQLQQIKQLGVYTEQDAKAAQEFAAASRDLFRALKMMLLPVFRAIVPIATAMSKGVQELSKHIRAFIPLLIALGTALTLHLFIPGKNVQKQIQWLRVSFKLLARAPLKTIAGGIKAIGLALKGFLLNPVTLAIAGLVALGIAIDDFIGWMNGDKNAFGDFWVSIFGSAENAKQVINQFIAEAKAAFNDFKETVKTLWMAVQPFLISFAGMLISLGRTAWDFAGMFKAALDVVFSVFAYLVTGSEDMKNRISTSLDAVQNKFNEVLADIKGYFASWWEFVSPIIDRVAGFFDMELPSLPSFSLFEGNPALATPGTAGTTNNNVTKETKVEAVINNTIQGNADGEAVRQMQDKTNYDFGGLVPQANASQSRI